MRHFRVHLVLILVALLVSSSPVTQVVAQFDGEDETCPEGLVYDQIADLCVLPEEIADETVEDQPQTIIAVDEQIKNLTVLAFSCPINWNPATRDIVASREMCADPVVPAPTLTILFDGSVVATTTPRGPVDVANDPALTGVPRPAGMWTIQENQQEGFEDPFAFCAIFNAEGVSRLTVAETVPGGTLNILLAAGEEVNCEWFSVATVPEVSGDPNALPIGGLTIDGFSCPDTTDAFPTFEFLRSVCIEKGVAPIEYTASLDGVVVSTKVGPTDAPKVDFQQGVDSRLLSGTWTIEATLPPAYEFSTILCTVTTAAGDVTNLDTLFAATQVELELAPGDIGHCWWFSHESEPRPGPSLGIAVLFRTCPESYDMDTGDLSTCTLPLAAPITIDFIRAGQIEETATVTAGATEIRSTINLGAPQSGEWTIRPHLPDDWIDPYFTCRGIDANGTLFESIDYFPPADGLAGVTASFGPNLMLQCTMWLFTGSIDGAVAIGARFCPDDFDVANPAAGNRIAMCGRVQGVNFTFSIDGGAPIEGTSGRNGMVIKPSEPGQWRISTDGQFDNRVKFVTCDHRIPALNVKQTIEPTINSDQLSITLDLDAGDSLQCEFYFGAVGGVPAASGETTELDTAPDDAGGTTTETATDTADGMMTETGNTGMDTGGTSTNQGGTQPDATGSSAPAQGSGASSGGNAPTQEVQGGQPGSEASGSDVPASAAGGSASSPDEWGSELSIQLYDCHAAVGDLTLDDLVEQCTPSEAPSSWMLNDERYEVDDGYAVWGGLEPMTVSVSSLAAAAQDDHRSGVYCSIAPPDTDPILSFELPVHNGGIEIVFDDAAVVYCAWFVDISSPDTGQAESPAATGGGQNGETAASPDGLDMAPSVQAPALTLRFWRCPEGVPYSSTSDQLRQTCAVEVVERSFMLTLGGVTTAETITGEATWELGDLTVQAEIGAGIESKVGCLSTWVQGDDGSMPMSLLDGGLLTITLGNSETIMTCDWFVFPGA
ncbi:MAG: hypothetical protein KC438_09745 [Thermomicrobiales bacterium]|nr:hypothetical protein [Thermomicrobiales bacterium]